MLIVRKILHIEGKFARLAQNVILHLRNKSAKAGVPNKDPTGASE